MGLGRAFRAKLSFNDLSWDLNEGHCVEPFYVSAEMRRDVTDQITGREGHIAQKKATALAAK